MDFMDLVLSDANIQSRLFDMSLSSFIRGKFSAVKFMFENSCLQISIAGERLKRFDDSSFIQDFQSFSIEFPSQIWLSILSLKKRPVNVQQ